MNAPKEINAFIFNKVFPITQVKIYRSGMEIIRTSKIKYKPEGIAKKKRGKIMRRSKQSLCRLAFTVANTDTEFMSLLTLTYPLEFPSNGKKVKKHLQHFLQKLKREWGEPDYIWFLEFQKRNAPHFHILTTIAGIDEYKRTWLGATWADIVAVKDTSEWYAVDYVHKREGKPIRKSAWADIEEENGAKKYALKYALKPEQTKVPPQFDDVGRFWGCNTTVKPVSIAIIDTDEEEVRAKLLREGNPCGEYEIIPKLVIKREGKKGDGQEQEQQQENG